MHLKGNGRTFLEVNGAWAARPREESSPFTTEDWS